MNPKEIAAREAKIAKFNPDEAGKLNGNLYGLPFTPEESEVVIVPVPWEVTVSYRGGTADGPEAILDASPQLDLFDLEAGEAWKMGLAMLPINEALAEKNDIMRKKARVCIDILEHGGDPDNDAIRLLSSGVNKACAEMNQWVYDSTKSWLNRHRIVGLVGGDHSTPLGFLRALSEQYDSFGILQIDAHADLRDAYEGFEFSHASIMFNALKIKQVTKLVQVGLRDVCLSENQLISDHVERISAHFDRSIQQELFKGTTWQSYCEKIISDLPDKVYISFDIDGLNPALCPNTGTPVPGGLEFEQALYLIDSVAASGRTIVGFDLVEVAKSETEWDAIVGARLLYRLAIAAARSKKVL